MNKYYLLLCSLALVFAASTPVKSCTCDLFPLNKSTRQQVLEAHDKAKALFVGKVLSVESSPGVYYRKVTLEIQSVWKGPHEEQLVILTGSGGGDCGYNFEVDGTYLVYAYQYNKSDLGTNICQRTKLVSRASADLENLGEPKVSNATLGSDTQKSVGTASDAELINDLASVQSGGLADEVVKRGVKMIPLLAKLKGDTRPYLAGGLGHSLSGTATIYSTQNQDLDTGRVITMEVAAIYLICAIYHNDIEFAQSPYLTDLTSPVAKRRANNSPVLVTRAWRSVEAWINEFSTVGIERMRARKSEPLLGADLSFW